MPTQTRDSSEVVLGFRSAFRLISQSERLAFHIQRRRIRNSAASDEKEINDNWISLVHRFLAQASRV